MPQDDFMTFLSAHRGRRVLYLAHRQADCDAIGSAYAMSTVLPGDVGCFQGIKTSGADLASTLNLTVSINPSVNAYEAVVIMDTMNADLVGAPLPSKYSLIDHHIAGGHRHSNFHNTLLPAAKWAWVQPREATCVVVTELLTAHALPLSRAAGLALLAGIMTDTAMLERAGPSSFRALTTIMETTGLSLSDATIAFTPRIRHPELRRVILDALRDLRVEQVGSWSMVLAVTDTLDHAFFVNSALVSLLADVRLVAFPSDNFSSMIIIEATDSVLETTALDVFATVQDLATRLNASAVWGTRTIGRLVAAGTPQVLLERTLESLRCQLAPRRDQ
jgi:bifunctional oligoribonuclease and PAP phosphatase NrnA